VASIWPQFVGEVRPRLYVEGSVEVFMVGATADSRASPERQVLLFALSRSGMTARKGGSGQRARGSQRPRPRVSFKRQDKTWLSGLFATVA
jgi:hypothetical protein